MSWASFVTEQPELAARVWAPFADERHGLIATIRRDGAPRISGIEAKIFDDQLWLGMMTDSLKGKDLLRDPRCELHSSSSLDRMTKLGDAKISGTAEYVTDADQRNVYRRNLAAAIDWDPGENFDLFLVEVTSAALATVGDDVMRFEVWRPGADIVVRERA